MRRLAGPVLMALVSALAALVILETIAFAAPRPAPSAIPTASPERASGLDPSSTASGNLSARTPVPGGGGPAQTGAADQPVAAPAAINLAPPVIGGRATWYAAHGMIGAAGPALRGYIGPRWRGSLVSVCAAATGMCVVVRLSDWCLCTGHGGRLIDLSDDAFAQLAPLSAGVLGVEITRVVLPSHLPPTDTAP